MSVWTVPVILVAAGCVVLALIYAFKDKIPILKHLPELTCGLCCGFGCLPADYMDGEAPRRANVQQAAPAFMVVTPAPVQSTGAVATAIPAGPVSKAGASQETDALPA